MKVVAKTGNNDVATAYIAEMENGKLIEFIESVEPPIPREKKWVLIVSTLYGCPVGCRFCDAGGHYKGKLTTEEMISQIDYLIRNRFPDGSIPVKKFKIQFARMGEPALNPNVLNVLSQLPGLYEAPGLLPTLSTIAPKGSDSFFDELITIKRELYRERFQLQFSIHTTDDKLRNILIPIEKWDFRKIAEFGNRFYTKGERKITLNFALAENMPVDPDIMINYFSPGKFLIKVTPVNPTFTANDNGLVSHILPNKEKYEILESLKEAGYEVILSIGETEENLIGSNCGQHIMNFLKEKKPVKDGYTYQLDQVINHEITEGMLRS